MLEDTLVLFVKLIKSAHTAHSASTAHSAHTARIACTARQKLNSK